MSRPWRIEFEGALYYVLSRGNEQQDICLDNEDRNPWPRPGLPVPLPKNSWRSIQCGRARNAHQVAPGQAWTCQPE